MLKGLNFMIKDTKHVVKKSIHLTISNWTYICSNALRFPSSGGSVPLRLFEEKLLQIKPHKKEISSSI
jgi:hypothetical protein